MAETIRREIYDKGDVVLLPFPFTNLKTTKKRPGLIFSPRLYNLSGDSTILFMTSNVSAVPREGDVQLAHYVAAGLPKPTLVRMKFITIANGLILKKLGTIEESDLKKVKAQVMRLMGLAG